MQTIQTFLLNKGAFMRTSSFVHKLNGCARRYIHTIRLFMYADVYQRRHLHPTPFVRYGNCYARQYRHMIPLFMRFYGKHSVKRLEDKLDASYTCLKHHFGYGTLSLDGIRVDNDGDASTCLIHHFSNGNLSNANTKLYDGYYDSTTCQEQHFNCESLLKETRKVYDDSDGDASSICLKHHFSNETLSKETRKLYNDDDEDGDVFSTCATHHLICGTVNKETGKLCDDDASICMKHNFSYGNRSLNASIIPAEPEDAISDIAKAVLSLILDENEWRAEIWTKIERIIGKVTPDFVFEVVKGLKDPSLALHFLNWSSSKEGYEPTAEAFTHIIARMTRKRNFNDAWLLLNEMKKHNLKADYAFSIFIHRLKRAGKVDGLVKAMCGMDILKVTPTVPLYTCALEFLFKKNHVEDVEYLYNRMLQDGLMPDKKLFEILIKGFSKMGKSDAAMLALESMKNRGVVPHLSVYITTICQMSESGKVECGHWFYKEMITSGCLPNIFGSHEVACALYGDDVLKQIEEFENVVHTMPSILRVHSLNNLLRFLFDIGKHDEATIVFNRLKSNFSNQSEEHKKTLTWNIDSYRIYIFGMYKLGHVVNAMEMYKELLRRGPKPTSDISSFLLLNLSSKKLVDEALDVCKHIIKCRDPIGPDAQKCFFTMLRVEKRLDIACKLFTTMRKKRCIDDGSDFVSLVGFNDDKDSL